MERVPQIDLAPYRKHLELNGSMQGHYVRELFAEIEKLQRIVRAADEIFAPIPYIADRSPKACNEFVAMRVGNLKRVLREVFGATYQC